MNSQEKPETMPEFVRRQYEFTAHIRDPERQPAPADVDARRMALYRELFYNNVAGFMANSFPVLHEILEDDHWHALIRDYFARHFARTPLFPEMPREFLRFLERERGPHPKDPPFLLELAHYEWVELALSIIDEEPPRAGIDPAGDLLSGIPVLSPLAWPLCYRFAVHRIGPDYRPQTPDSEHTHLLVYRDMDDEVGFIEINPITARLLTAIGNNDARCGHALLEDIAEELGHPRPEAVVAGGLEILEDLRRRGVILGVREQAHASIQRSPPA